MCVVWCDFIGIVLARELAEFRVSGTDIFEGHRYVVGARNEVGRDLWFGFSTNKEWERTLSDLHVNLNTRRYKSFASGGSRGQICDELDGMDVDGENHED